MPALTEHEQRQLQTAWWGVFNRPPISASDYGAAGYCLEEVQVIAGKATAAGVQMYDVYIRYDDGEQEAEHMEEVIGDFSAVCVAVCGAHSRYLAGMIT